VLGIAVIALGFHVKMKSQRQKTVDSYVMYVDSLGNVASEDAKKIGKELKQLIN
jgi:hypothetical protein